MIKSYSNVRDCNLDSHLPSPWRIESCLFWTGEQCPQARSLVVLPSLQGSRLRLSPSERPCWPAPHQLRCSPSALTSPLSILLAGSSVIVCIYHPLWCYEVFISFLLHLNVRFMRAGTLAALLTALFPGPRMNSAWLVVHVQHAFANEWKNTGTPEGIWPRQAHQEM